jgi:hypothetical protein
MKKIKWINVDFISLCPRGKNRLKILYKEDGRFEAGVSIKQAPTFDKNGEIIAAVYIPNHIDMDGEFASEDFAIKSMAYSHARNGGKLDLRHDGKSLTKEQAYVAESFIIQKGDPRFADLVDDEGQKVDATGGWGAVIKLEDPVLKSSYEFDGWEGVSLFGLAMIESMKSDEEKVIDRLLIQSKEKVRMDESKVLELIKKALEPITESLVKLIKVKKEEPAPKKEEELKAPIFKGDPTRKEDVSAFQKELKKYNLMKSVDWQNPEEVGKILLAIDKEDEKDKKLSKEDSDKEIERLKAEITNLEKASKQAPSDPKDPKDAPSEDARLFKIGKEAGKYVNGLREPVSKK